MQSDLEEDGKIDENRELSPSVSSIGLGTNMIFSCLLLVMGSTLLILSGWGPVIRFVGLPRLPSTKCGEVLIGFPMLSSTWKKEYDNREEKKQSKDKEQGKLTILDNWKFF